MNAADEEMEIVQITNKYDKYFPKSGGQINAGEAASVTKSEAELLVKAGAAVRMPEPADGASDAEKALSHPPKDKMMKGNTSSTK